MKQKMILLSILILLFSFIGTSCSSPYPVAAITPTATIAPTPLGGGLGKIAFQSNRDGSWDIYVMNADGSDPTRLTHNQALDKSPTWSPDGQKIAFYSDRDGNYQIYVMNADGSNPLNLTNNLGNPYEPSW